MNGVGPERCRHGGSEGIIGPPTSPLGLSPKIEKEKRRSQGYNDIQRQHFRKAVKEGSLNKIIRDI